MLVVGPVLLITFTIYELFWAPFPLMPKRILYNKTFATSVIINFIYLLADGIRSPYLSSIVLVGKNWSYKNWTYFNNALTVSLCFFGLVSGVHFRIAHRYKYLNCMGIFIRTIAYCIPLRSQETMANTGSFVMCQVLTRLGSAYDTVGTIISSQASVPHQDMSTVMTLLLLWSTVGSAIGYTISGSVWTSRMYNYLRETIPSSVTDEEVYAYYTDLSSLYYVPRYDPIRQGAVKALANICPYLFAAPVALEFLNFLISFMQTNYYLGDTHNATEDQHGKDPTNPNQEKQEIPTTWKSKLLYLFS
ncbi:Siderophore iron transporter 3 [Meyerozyma sp. JA9]|nr:Siderophore iron transporter 3 [Meyerozyma sp. JA9]